MTLAAVSLVLAGTVDGLIGRGFVRHGAIATAVIGVGLLAGQALGPQREPLTHQDGAMTIHLASPVVASATGSAYCQNVASAKEFDVGGDANMQLDTHRIARS